MASYEDITIGKTTGANNNIEITPSDIKFKQGSSNLAQFTTNELTDASEKGLQIISKTNISLYPNLSTEPALVANQHNGLNLVTFGPYNEFSSEPLVYATSTKGAITCAANTFTNVPLTTINFEQHSTGSLSSIFNIDNGAIKLDMFDGVMAEISAGAYVQAVSGTVNAQLFLYHYQSGNDFKWHEIAAAGPFIAMTGVGASIQMATKVIGPLHAGDKLLLKVRTIGGKGKVYPSNKDTFLRVKLI